jgi:hypothetical protein
MPCHCLHCAIAEKNGSRGQENRIKHDPSEGPQAQATALGTWKKKEREMNRQDAKDARGRGEFLCSEGSAHESLLDL